MTSKTLRKTLFGAVAVAALAALTTTAEAVFVSGDFDPPDLSGSHTFQLLGDCLHSGTYTLSVNGEGSPCSVSLTRLTVLLDHFFPLNFSSFLPFFGINSIRVKDGQLAGINSNLIGPAIGSGNFPGSWWIQYYFDSESDPVRLFHNCTTSDCIVDIAFTVTFFLSDANGNRLPEPGSLLLIAAAIAAAGFARRRRA